MYGPSGAAVWTTPVVDLKRQRIYFGTGENLSHPATDTSDAIIALDMASGELAWRYQTTRGDVWNAARVLPMVVFTGAWPYSGSYRVICYSPTG